MLRTIAVAALLTAAACSNRSASPSSPSSAPEHPDGVCVFGSFRGLFHEGRTGSEVALGDLLPDPRLYAVGALADLAGEVTIAGGRAYLALSGGDSPRTVVSSSPDAGAALLVAARVPDWRETAVERHVPWEELDDEIERLAASLGLDTDARIPFLIEGDFEDIHWHVVDGARLPPGANSCEDHRAAAAKEARARTRALLVGFYSKSDEGVFTPMGCRTHIHCIVEGPLASGHVDRATVAPGATLKLPAAVRRRDSSATPTGR